MGELDTEWLIIESLWVVAALAAALMARRLRKDARLLTVLLSLTIVSHVIVFNNPAFFYLSNKFLGTAEIGWRQKDALNKETQRFLRSDSRPDHLFVGSSQTGAVFDQYVEQQSNCRSFVLAGMGPLDFLLYAWELKRIVPRSVVLYLSDFDLGNSPSLLGAKLAPPLSVSQIVELLRIRESYSTAFSISEIQDFLFCQAVPAYRYQYVFRGWLDKVFRRTKGFPEKDVTAITDEENFENQLKGLATLSNEHFDLNLHLLDIFIREMAASGIGVIIVEGHYHPKALRTNEELHNLAKARLEKFAGQHPNCVYIATGDTFAASAYRDATHVVPEAGIAFAASLRVELDRASESIAKRIGRIHS